MYLPIGFCNNTTQKIMSVHSLHYEVSNNHTVDQWHPFESVKFIDNPWQNMKSSTHHGRMPSQLPLQGHNITKFYLSTAHTHFSSIPIGCHLHHRLISLHVHWSLSFVVHYLFTVTTYYSTSLNLLISHASQWQQKSLSIPIKHCSILL